MGQFTYSVHRPANLLHEPMSTVATDTPPTDFSLQAFLQSWMAGKTEFFFLDIGAYHGEISASLLDYFPDATGILFEPTPKSYEALKIRFQSLETVQIVNCALSDRSGVVDFYTTQTPAKNSLLNPKVQLKADEFAASSIEVETLDQFIHQRPDIQAIDFMKIDTQGNDLNVLRGAEETIQKFQPAVLVEAIFIPRYQNQCSYFEIFEWMRSHQYHLARFFDTHVTPAGIIAFSDFLFLPSSKLTETYQNKILFTCIDPSHLIAQNRILATACDERLQLIHDLNKAAQERLEVIEVLDSEVQRLRAEVEHLQTKLK